MAESKRSKVESFIRRMVRESFAQYAFECDRAQSDYLHNVCQRMEYRIAGQITCDSYRMKELQDIMDWKRPPRTKE